MKIDKKRWLEAQKFEFQDWTENQSTANDELEEAINKYSSIFSSLNNIVKIKSTSKILDVGCNLTCVSLMIKKGKHYGIDPLANKLHIQDRVKNIVVVNGSGEKMPYNNKMFDLVICRNVIDHTFRPEKVIKEMCRVSKPNGYVFITCYVYNDFISLIKRVSEFLKVLHNVGHPHIYNQKTFHDLINTNMKIVTEYLVYTGKNSNDFGKNNSSHNIPLIHKIINFISCYLFGNKWFVKEIAYLCKLN